MVVNFSVQFEVCYYQISLRVGTLRHPVYVVYFKTVPKHVISKLNSICFAYEIIFL